MKSKLYHLINWSLPYLAICVMAYIIMYPQIISHGVILGTDSIFHFNRFYDAAKQIQHLDFSYFQSNYCFQQSGRVINAVYGPLFAYLNGALLGFLGTWYRYEVISDFVVYVVGGIGMYLLATKAHSSRRFALLVSLIFMNIGWLPRWQLAQNMNAWGAMLAPYMLMCAITMLQDRARPVHWLPLMIVMTTVIQIHLLSSIFFVLTLLPFFIIGLVKTSNRWGMIKETALAVIGTVILTANVWGALLMLNLHNHIAAPADFNMLFNSLKPSQFNSTRNYLIYFCWLLFLAQLLYVCRHWRRSLVNTTVTLFGFIILMVSSIWTPWDQIAKAIPALSHTLQFPSRLTVIAYPLLLLGVAISATDFVCGERAPRLQLRRKITVGILLFMVAQVLVPNTSDVFRRTARYKSPAVLNSSSAIAWVTENRFGLRRSVHDLYPGQLLTMVEKRSPDYLPVPKKYLNNRKYIRSFAYQDQIINHAGEYKHTVLPHGGLQLAWNAATAGRVRLPIITYHESQLTLNGKRLHNYKRSRIGAPYVYQRQGQNTVTLYFKVASWFKVLLAISLVGISILLLYGIYALIRSLPGFWYHITT
ncbi:cell division protein [Limosilactobacillus sp.]|uniref:cell division protein n=1 Tax=Limosilactobacillus sp. TaxID=2773925 RepID=UPI0025C10CE5|nr:cell division protein [Limosilactobacillus sp.]MCH3922095.1 cell division protein [Limosilactobacillus sp.]MCH3928866.1 cell division protein [Limosilactobacillus sp.]